MTENEKELLELCLAADAPDDISALPFQRLSRAVWTERVKPELLIDMRSYYEVRRANSESLKKEWARMVRKYGEPSVVAAQTVITRETP